MRMQTPQVPHPRWLLPLWDFSSNAVITTHGCCFEVVEVSGLDSEHLDAARLDEAASALYEGWKSDLQDGTFLQFVMEGHGSYDDHFTRFESVPAPSNAVLRHQREERLRFLRGSNLRRHEVLLAVGSASGFGKAEHRALDPAEMRARRESAERLSKTARSVLDRAGIRTRSASSERVRRAFFEALNPGVRERIGKDSGANPVPS